MTRGVGVWRREGKGDRNVKRGKEGSRTRRELSTVDDMNDFQRANREGKVVVESMGKEGRNLTPCPCSDTLYSYHPSI